LQQFNTFDASVSTNTPATGTNHLLPWRELGVSETLDELEEKPAETESSDIKNDGDHRKWKSRKTTFFLEVSLEQTRRYETVSNHLNPTAYQNSDQMKVFKDAIFEDLIKRTKAEFH